MRDRFMLDAPHQLPSSLRFRTPRPPTIATAATNNDNDNRKDNHTHHHHDFYDRHSLYKDEVVTVALGHFGSSCAYVDCHFMIGPRLETATLGGYGHNHDYEW